MKLQIDIDFKNDIDLQPWVDAIDLAVEYHCNKKFAECQINTIAFYNEDEKIRPSRVGNNDNRDTSRNSQQAT